MDDEDRDVYYKHLADECLEDVSVNLDDDDRDAYYKHLADECVRVPAAPVSSTSASLSTPAVSPLTSTMPVLRSSHSSTVATRPSTSTSPCAPSSPIATLPISRSSLKEKKQEKKNSDDHAREVHFHEVVDHDVVFDCFEDLKKKKKKQNQVAEFDPSAAVLAIIEVFDNAVLDEEEDFIANLDEEELGETMFVHEHGQDTYDEWAYDLRALYSFILH